MVGAAIGFWPTSGPSESQDPWDRSRCRKIRYAAIICLEGRNRASNRSSDPSLISLQLDHIAVGIGYVGIGVFPVMLSARDYLSACACDLLDRPTVIVGIQFEPEML